MEDTIVALATPAGVGAIGVIRLSGSGAIDIAQSVFSKTLSDKESHTLHFGRIVSKSSLAVDGKPESIVLDEVVLSLFKAPHSYTGENVVELSCHGSQFIQQKIIELLIEKGARTAQAGEFTLRAFLNGKLDLTQAEAVADLIASDSKIAHEMAINQMRGGFSKRINELRQQLIDFASLVELELDFGEEDVEFANRKELVALVSEIRNYVNGLKDSFALGQVMKNGISTVIAGKPNAGKSTVLNALLNEDRAIVSSIAGTTRDTVEESLAINGVIYRFIDTAGIRASSDEIEGIGVEKTFEKIEKADLILYVFDAQITDVKQLEKEIRELKAPNKRIIPIANKIDLCDIGDLRRRFSLYSSTCYISSKQGDISELLAFLEENASELNQSSKTLVNNNRHFEALHKSSDALSDVLEGFEVGRSTDLIAFDIRKALHHLGEITGAVTSDDLLANIFGRFCIGK